MIATTTRLDEPCRACWIATFCLENGYRLLFSDRDFRPFVDHLGLEAA